MIETANIRMNIKDNELLHFAGEKLGRMEEASPSDSAVKLFIDYEQWKTTVCVELCSQALRFVISEVAINPYLAVENALLEFRSRVAEWHSKRFEEC